MLIDKTYKIEKLGDPIIDLPPRSTGKTTAAHAYAIQTSQILARVPITLGKDDTCTKEEVRIAPEAFSLARAEVVGGSSNMCVKIGAKAKIGDASFILHQPDKEPGKTPNVRTLEEMLEEPSSLCVEPGDAIGIRVSCLKEAADAIGAKKIALFILNNTLVIKPIDNIDDPNGPVSIIPKIAVAVQEEMDFPEEDEEPSKPLALENEDIKEAEVVEEEEESNTDIPQPSKPPQPEPVDEDENSEDDQEQSSPEE